MDRAYIVSNSNEIPWRKSVFAEGVLVKDLGSSDGRSIQLVRFEPGAKFPWHKHTGPEFLYILEGEAIQRGKRLGSGWVGIAPTGTEEDDFTSEIGATFVLVYSE
jgi:anti-sigma factor ChrR (cupin superfamily)